MKARYSLTNLKTLHKSCCLFLGFIILLPFHPTTKSGILLQKKSKFKNFHEISLEMYVHFQAGSA